MASHMKTTIHIPDALLAEAQKLAATENTTLKALVQEGLQNVIACRAQRKPFVLRDCSFPPASEVKELVQPKHWDEIVHLVYEGRGG
jgi:Bacterial antitoxin of type II TA system, VapB